MCVVQLGLALLFILTNPHEVNQVKIVLQLKEFHITCEQMLTKMKNERATGIQRAILRHSQIKFLCL